MKSTKSILVVISMIAGFLLIPGVAHAGTVQSRGVYIDAVGRAGGKIVVTVMSKLANGATSTTDAAGAYLFSCGNAVTYDSNYAYSSTPYKIENSIAYFRVILNAGSTTGSCGLYAGVTDSVAMTLSAFSSASRVVNSYTFEVGSTPSKLQFSNQLLQVSIAQGNSEKDLTPASLAISDSAGVRTILLTTETLTLNASGASNSSLFSIRKGTNSPSSSFTYSGSDYTGDGIYRFDLSLRESVIGSISAHVLNSVGIALVTSSMLVVTSSTLSGSEKVITPNLTQSDRSYAVGTDGKLYGWGQLSSGLADAVTGSDIFNATYSKPSLIDFPKAQAGKSLNFVKNITPISKGVLGVANDGSLWGTGRFSGISNEQVLQGNLQPVFTFEASVNAISESAKYFLLSDGKLLTQSGNKFSRVDLSGLDSPTVTQVAYMSSSNTTLLLSSSGNLYSFGSNTYGELGQGNDTSTSLGLVAIPANRKVAKIYAGTTFGVAKMVDGTFWSWGNNNQGQQGKLASEVPYQNTPRIIIAPTNFTIIDVVASGALMIIGSSSIYASDYGTWSQRSIPTLSGSDQIRSVGIYSTPTGYLYNYLIADSSGHLYQMSGPSGSCSTNNVRVRSNGQFGEIWFVDPLSTGSKLYIDSSTTTSITNVVTAIVNTPFTIQAANVKTACYQTNELTFAWDKDGNGTLETPDTPTVGDSGYLGLNASFNYSTPGRRVVTLGVTTPDSVTLTVNFTLGIEPSSRSELTKLDTSTTQIVSQGYFNLALTSSGSVFGWGYNDYGQLGISTNILTRRNFPTQLQIPESITPTSVAVITGESLIIDTLGRVWSIGRQWLVDGTNNISLNPTRVTSLQNYKIREIKDYLALTTDGRLLIWNLNDRSVSTIPDLAGLYVKSFNTRIRDNGCEGNVNYYYTANAVDAEGNVWEISLNYYYQPITITQLAITNAKYIKGNQTSSIIIGNDGSIHFSSYPGCSFGSLTKPSGVTVSDAGAYGENSNTVAVSDTSGVVWTNSINQSAGIFQPGTWVKLSSIDSVKANSGDQPYFFGRSSTYIGLSSGRIFATQPGSYYDNATCNTSNNRVFSSGQFGSTYFQDAISSSSMSAIIGSRNSVSFSSGQAFAATAGDNLVFKITGASSSCFGGTQQLTATADLDGDGTFETALSPTNESGTYSFIATSTAPSSGKKTISILLATPVGTTKTITVDVGVYNTSTDSAITNRTQVMHTGYNTSFAVGSDGYGYVWGGSMQLMNVVTSTPPRTYLKPTKIEITGNPKIVDGAVYSSADDETVNGLLVVDENGKLWSWATRRTASVPASTFATGSVPIVPTQVSAFNGINIKKVAVDAWGYRGMALDDKGNVYYWDSSNLTPRIVDGLAGIVIKDIYANGSVLGALSTSNQLHTWNGQPYLLGRNNNNVSCSWCYDNNPGIVAISDQIEAVSLGFAKYVNVSTALTKTGKLFSWGYFKSGQVVIPEQTYLPGGRTPISIGSNGSRLIVVASDKTWWYQNLDSTNNIVYYQLTNVPTSIRNTFVTFSTGDGTGIRTSDSNLYTTVESNAGTCGVIGSYTRVMSSGQFGATYSDDTIDLSIDGLDISRPNQSNTLRITANSRCFGAIGVSVTASFNGGSTYLNPNSSSTTDDGNYLNTVFNYTPTTTGPLTIRIKGTTSDSVTATASFQTLVVPLPPSGRQVGVSVNGGARYTNTSNVTLDLVWPDGVYKIYVSNDGGFAPGTVTEIDLQNQISWRLPVQAVIPLPSIVYARFGDSSLYYFDDIILDAISPILTFASAQP